MEQVSSLPVPVMLLYADYESRLLRRSVELLRSNNVNAIYPLKVFPASEVVQAFRYFSKGTRMGKVAVSFEMPCDIPVSTTMSDHTFDSADIN